ncbi:uncharacterized protein LOC111343319 isoform X1 [Stylophora pistillata]|uniref:uncharacterized protein LOC111343319 isoform X1 n=1 Tax=Stylophora pistillata TaxID=50429 RepID=UPI000C04E74C|nr:uncharacterized protein LOC111343319 isoform X1 [Stylophora pistillata]
MLLCYVFLFIVIWHVQLSQASEQCRRSTYSEYGHHLSGHVVSTQKTSSISECGMICSSESRCRSLNFRIKDKSCDLNDANKHTHPGDFGPKEGSVYMNKVDEFKSCSEILNKWPDAESGYYWIDIGSRKEDVYCDMEKHGGGWTLVVDISSNNNDHLQSVRNNCINDSLCVPFTDQDQGRKLGDSDIHELARTEGTFRVDVLKSNGTLSHTVFYQIPSGPNKFNSTCRQGNCPRIIISHSHPYHWETNNCTSTAVGYRIFSGCHSVFDGHDNYECNNSSWSSSKYANERALYGYPCPEIPDHDSRGIYRNRTGRLYVK